LRKKGTDGKETGKQSSTWKQSRPLSVGETEEWMPTLPIRHQTKPKKGVRTKSGHGLKRSEEGDNAISPAHKADMIGNVGERAEKKTANDAGMEAISTNS